MKDIHREAFREEAYELLSELEGSLLELEEAPDDGELIGRIFRAMHTIKGSGSMFGFDDVAAFTHQIETVYDKVRNGQLQVTKELISLTLQARDFIKIMLDESPEETVREASLQQAIDGFVRLGLEKEGVGSTEPAAGSSAPGTTEDEEMVTYRIRFRPSKEIFLSGTNPLLLLEELRGLGECSIVAQLDDIPDLEHMNPEYCYMGWDIILTSGRGMDTIKDVFIFVEDICDIKIETIAGGAGGPDEPGDRRIGEILLDRGEITREDLRNVLSERKYLGEILCEKGIVTQNEVDSALTEQQHVRKIREKTSKEEAISSIRVPAEKLDILVNLVGELVTVQARLSQTASISGDNDLGAIAEEVERLTAELRDNTMSIRMLPIGTTFGRFKRLIRDLSQELGKEIEMTTEGAETELDKTVIERLNDPLVHVIRNSIDHGIESPEKRLSDGKPRAGVIHLSASHSGANVIIRIKDDGKGLDREAILAKAIEKGLASAGQELTDRDVFGFIFAPGFSTASRITSVSGRGVGMDVVKKAIDGLGGSIQIASEQGKGTTITIKLPLTLAIVEGLLVRLADEHFVLPLSIVEECVELTNEDTRKAHGRNIANIRGEIVPYVRLRNEFRIPGEPPPIEQIVITGVNGDRVGLVVDSVVGEHQTVIKTLGKVYRGVDAVSGATILGNGTVALIVDVPKLVRNVELAEAACG
ncbi:MAG: Chemotaxis protein CheA [Syntrophorhabdaceae bacterium PtaU1.Bin034]|nr:MAG: Chemotaxis protein CheA [Syntrophorhabdaceae bacterium PtaU1.Bin034]